MIRNINARFPGTCITCSEPFPAGFLVAYNKETRKCSHIDCSMRAAEATTEEAEEAREIAVSEAAKPAFVPSVYQQAVFDFIEHDHRNAFVSAVAGSGKTTTIVESLDLLQGKEVLFLAFNKSIVTDLAGRVPAGAEVRTLNSFGHRTVLKYLEGKGRKGIKLETGKNLRNLIKAIAAEYVEPPLKSGEAPKTAIEAKEHLDAARDLAFRLASLAKATLADLTVEAEVFGLVDHYGLDANGALPLATQFALIALERSRQIGAAIDFDDQLYLPVVLKMPVQQYQMILVDEAQDLSLVQMRLIAMALAPGGRIVAVGDRAQAIYGFRGADCYAVDRLIKEFSMIELPLSISYRCPKKVVALAKEFVPEIEASDAAIEGEIFTAETDLEQEQILARLTTGHMVLCRTNAPLVKICFDLIRRGQKAVMRGRDIGVGLTTLIKKIAGFTMHDFIENLEIYRYEECARLNAAERPTEALEDKVDTILALCDGVTSTDDLVAKIKDIFSDQTIGVVCSSVHRAKGLESQSIVIARPELMPFPRASKDHEMIQERNLMYVAVTRSKQTLTLLGRGFGDI